MSNYVTLGDSANLAAIKRLAMDVGKEVVAYVEYMYPASLKAVNEQSMKLSLRNCVYNQIIEAMRIAESGDIDGNIAVRKAQRKKLKKMWQNINAMPTKE
jgi:hypothetical protein